MLSLDSAVFVALNDEYIVNPVKTWRDKGSGAGKSQFLHAFIGSTTDWGYSPDLDLPEGLIEKFVDEVVLPGLRSKLAELEKRKK